MNGIDKELADAEKDILGEKYKTALNKARLINQIKTGLGIQIKQNPGKAKIIKKSYYQRFTIWLAKIFTKF